MDNQLVLSSSSSVYGGRSGGGGTFLPAAPQVERGFFENVPIEWIMKCFEEAFKRTPQIKGPDEPLTLYQLVSVFQKVHEWARDTLRSGDFHYIIRHMVDQIDETFGWEYNIFGSDIPVVFNVQTAWLDNRGVDVTMRTCLRGVYENLLQAQRHIDEFNALPARKVRPLIPKLDIGPHLDYIMGHVLEQMKQEYARETGRVASGVGLDVLRGHAFSTRVISEGFKAARGSQIVQGADLHFDVFDVTHAGWAHVRIAVKFAALGMRFILAEDEVAFANRRRGSEIPPIVGGFLERAASSIRHWNWLIEGGHTKIKQATSRGFARMNISPWR